jgi:hypothetical protein
MDFKVLDKGSVRQLESRAFSHIINKVVKLFGLQKVSDAAFVVFSVAKYQAYSIVDLL